MKGAATPLTQNRLTERSRVSSVSQTGNYRIKYKFTGNRRFRDRRRNSSLPVARLPLFDCPARRFSGLAGLCNTLWDRL